MSDVPDARLRAMGAFVRFQERAMRDLGLNPNRTQYAEVEAAFRRDGLPVTLAEYVEYLRGRADGEGEVEGGEQAAEGGGGTVVHGVRPGVGEGARRLVRGVSGPADGVAEPGDPGERPARSGVRGRGGVVGRGGAAGVASTDGAGGPVAADDAGPPQVVAGEEQVDGTAGVPADPLRRVRLTRYWLAVAAGSVGEVTAERGDGGVAMAAVVVCDRRVWVPAEYLEVLA